MVRNLISGIASGTAMERSYTTQDRVHRRRKVSAWAQTGDNTYQANHFAITYDATGVYTGTRNFIETITLSPGGTKYSGTMVINVYDAKGTQTDHLTAQVVGVRVTLDTTP
jgi:hypothetical protein